MSEARFGAWERIARVMSMERRFFGQPYGRCSARVERSVAKCVFESKAFALAAGIGHFGGRSAVSTLAAARNPKTHGCGDVVVR
jgi:hypothetical protein